MQSRTVTAVVNTQRIEVSGGPGDGFPLTLSHVSAPHGIHQEADECNPGLQGFSLAPNGLRSADGFGDAIAEIIPNPGGGGTTHVIMNFPDLHAPVLDEFARLIQFGYGEVEEFDEASDVLLHVAAFIRWESLHDAHLLEEFLDFCISIWELPEKNWAA